GCPELAATELGTLLGVTPFRHFTLPPWVGISPARSDAPRCAIVPRDRPFSPGPAIPSSRPKPAISPTPPPARRDRPSVPWTDFCAAASLRGPLSSSARTCPSAALLGSSSQNPYLFPTDFECLDVSRARAASTSPLTSLRGISMSCT